MESFEVLGCRVDAAGRDEAVSRIAALANGGRPGLVVTLGVEMVMTAQRDAEFRRAVNDAALVTCDTIGLLLASRLRGGPLRERVTGVELVDALAARSAARGDVQEPDEAGPDQEAQCQRQQHQPGGVHESKSTQYPKRPMTGMRADPRSFAGTLESVQAEGTNR